jgi:hypothetical protein
MPEAVAVCWAMVVCKLMNKLCGASSGVLQNDDAMGAAAGNHWGGLARKYRISAATAATSAVVKAAGPK